MFGSGFGHSLGAARPRNFLLSSSSSRHDLRPRRQPLPPPAATPSMPSPASARMAAHVTLFAAAAALGGMTQPLIANAAAAAAGGRASSVAASCSAADASSPAVASAGPRWSVRRTAGDGACMFRAVVQGASLADSGGELSPDDEERGARALRAQVVQALRDHRDDIEPFLPGIAPDFDAYCAQMARHSTWGGEPELAMAAQHVLRRPLAVYSARLADRLARAGGGGWGAPPGDDDDAAGGLPPPVVTYGEDFLRDPTAPHVVRLLWSGNHYETLVDEHRARRLREEQRRGGGDSGSGSSGEGSGGGRSRL